MANLVTSLIVAFWVSAIALLSVQNARPVTLRFLTLQSVQLPVGLVLSFSAAVGMVGTALILPARKAKPKPQDDDRFEEI